MQYNRLIISPETLAKHMTELQNGGKNRAYITDDIPDVVFMQYSEKGGTFFAMVNAVDYKKIKNEYWSGTNNYVTTHRNGKTVYLQRELCPNLQKGQIAHHMGNRFDYRHGMLKAVTPKNHDQHRTYGHDLVK